ncbi:OCIA domain-containing protein 1-like [Condylostylus longicornis]|uniref:OCIA domain-containing protein 1-like n=1 Tax=Condylostylus longicornis TaxID=2530218 RepID=UPI00244E5BC3|nr:OCIA domain-containing protein 1-like [Condylostylus longicornis]
MSDTSQFTQSQSRSGDRDVYQQSQFPIGSEQVQPRHQFSYSQPSTQGQKPQHPLANYQFSSEELRVLRECNTESFFQRCIPFSAVFGLGSHLAVKNGFLTPNPKYGSIPKVVVSVIIGYFLGKISYQQKCAEKMMQLPNSKLGEILRQKKQGGIVGSLPNQGMGTPGFGLTPFSAAPNNDVYDDTHLKDKQTRSNALDLDTERPTFSLDDSQNFGDIGNQNETLPLEPPKKLVTYEELRKTNRDNYYKRAQSNAPIIQDSPSVIRTREIPPSTSNSDEAQNEPIKPMKKNQYGDVWSQ